MDKAQALKEALEKCKAKFAYYAECHAAKGGTEKEVANLEMVGMIDAVLALPAQDAAPVRDAARWNWVRTYMAGSRTDLDDEFVDVCCTDKPEELDAFVDAAIKAQEGSST